MRAEDFTVGTRVRATTKLGGCYPGASFEIEAGVTGTVIAVFPDADEDAGEPIAHVRLDAHEPDLEEWDNILHIYTGGDAPPEDFEPIIGFGT